jgi:hypothetical protein
MSLRYQIRRLVVPTLALLDPARASRAAEDTVLPALEEASLYALREIQDNTPVGATAILRGSIQQATETIRGNPVSFRGEVFTLQPHALPVETGSKPHWAPIRPLKLWAKRILGDEGAAYAIRHAIAKRGTKPTWFWRDATARATPRIDSILRTGWERYIDRLLGR